MMSQGFKSTNGILQGCPLSVVLLNLLMQVWCNLIQSEAPEATPRCYADDAQASTKQPRVVRRVLELTIEFCRLTGMRLNAKKIHLWATEKELREQLRGIMLDGMELPVVYHDRSLGAQLSFDWRWHNSPDTQSRLLSAEKCCERIKAVPLGVEQRAQLIESMVIPKLLYDTSVQPLSKKRDATMAESYCLQHLGPALPCKMHRNPVHPVLQRACCGSHAGVCV